MSYIERESLLSEIQEELDFATTFFSPDESKYVKSGLRRIKKLVEKHSTADVVEVVRCKDCKHYEIHKPTITLNCEREGKLVPMMPNDYCSYGERSEK